MASVSREEGATVVDVGAVDDVDVDVVVVVWISGRLLKTTPHEDLARMIALPMAQIASKSGTAGSQPTRSRSASTLVSTPRSAKAFRITLAFSASRSVSKTSRASWPDTRYSLVNPWGELVAEQALDEPCRPRHAL